MPMASVISNAYQRQWIAKNRESESKERDFKSTQKMKLMDKTMSPTKASMGYVLVCVLLYVGVVHVCVLCVCVDIIG